MKKHKILLFFFLQALLFCQTSDKKYTVATVAFYNVENLFDTIPSVDVVHYPTKTHKSISLTEVQKLDIDFNEKTYVKDADSINLYIKLIGNEEFTPNGSRNWTTKKYKKKIENLAFVLANIGFKKTKSVPAIVGLAEIENEQVLQDLISHPYLSHYNYKIAHQNSFDARGIDCALLYQANRFKIIKQKTFKIDLSKSDYKEYTRDILLVSGKLDGENISFLVNHWPSRRGGEKASEPNRLLAAEALKNIIHELKTENPNEKIVVMGDFNDNPTNKSIKQMLSSKATKEQTADNDLFNPTEKLFKKGYGTTAFRDNWFLFDQLLVSKNLINESEPNSYQFLQAGIFDESYLKTAEGKYKNYPERSFSGDVFNPNGFSDHFPVYLYLWRKFVD